MKKLVAETSIEIKAPVERVWNVLVKPQYINQWDDMPDHYDYRKDLQLGSEITWLQSEDRFTRLTVIEMVPNKIFRLALFKSNWKKNLPEEAITYSYRLTEEAGVVKLSVEIGDFSILPEGEKYYEAALAFAKDAVQKIKSLVLTEG